MEEKVKLHSIEKEDLKFIHTLMNNPDIMSYWFEEPHKSMSQLEKQFEQGVNNQRMRRFVVKKGDKNIGYIGLFSIDWVHRNAEFGIMIDPKQQGKGYASTATDLAIAYALTNLNLHKLYLYVDKANERAIHIYKKKGFHEEGMLREEFFVNGSYRDVITMAILQRDFIKRQS